MCQPDCIQVVKAATQLQAVEVAHRFALPSSAPAPLDIPLGQWHLSSRGSRGRALCSATGLVHPGASFTLFCSYFHSPWKVPSRCSHLSQKDANQCNSAYQGARVALNCLNLRANNKSPHQKGKMVSLVAPSALPHPLELCLPCIDNCTSFPMEWLGLHVLSFGSGFNHYFHTCSWRTGKLSIVGYFCTLGTEFNPFSLPQ